MTEEEGDLLHNISNQYWYDFSELVNSTLLLVPALYGTHLKRNWKSRLLYMDAMMFRPIIKRHLTLIL